VFRKSVQRAWIRGRKKLDLNCLDKKCILAPVVIGNGQTEMLLVETISLPCATERVLDIKATGKIVSTHLAHNKVIFNAILQQTLVLCCSCDQIKCLNVNLPFDGFVEIPGAEPGDTVNVNAVEVCITPEPNIADHCLKEKITINISLTVIRKEQITIKVCIPGPYCISKCP